MNLKINRTTSIPFFLSLLVLFSFLTACKSAEPILPQEETKTAPTIVEQPTTQLRAELPEDYACAEGTAVGYVKCAYLPNGDLSLTLSKKASQTTNYQLTGVKAIFLTLQIDPITKANVQSGNTTIQGNAIESQQITYTIPFSEYPTSEKLEVRPIIKFGASEDTKKVCVNQRIMVIPKTNCKKI